jgi:hypothetical protein
MNMGSGVILIPCSFFETGFEGIPGPEKEEEKIRNPKHEIRNKSKGPKNQITKTIRRGQGRERVWAFKL